MSMEILNIEELKKSKYFIENIRWDITPKIFMDPSSAGKESGEAVDISYGYMFYVDLINERPALVIMQLKSIISKTVGYIHKIPEDLLREAMDCLDSECVAGMYPVPDKLVDWLKQAFGIAQG